LLNESLKVEEVALVYWHVIDYKELTQ
jgi:hypothetical protein